MRTTLTQLTVLASALLLASAGLAVSADMGAAGAEKKAEMSDADREQKLTAARKRLDAAAREIEELSMPMNEHLMPDVRSSATRVPTTMLGINPGWRRDRGSNEGVEIANVSPGGAAAEAGLTAGDLLVELNGRSLKHDGNTAPREKLLREMREVKPGDRVVVGYKRGGKPAKATLKAHPLPYLLVSNFTRAEPTIVDAPYGGDVAFGLQFAFRHVETVFGSAELVPLTPKLGQHFGTDKGLLVVRAPDDSGLQLEDGDVIVCIDGRSPSSLLHAVRIVSSYQQGEKLKLDVLRAKKKISFEITIPTDA